MMAAEKMKRVTKSHPCLICGKPDWCLVARDGSAAICARIAEGAVRKCGDAGYLHLLKDRHNGRDRHTRGARWRHSATVAHGPDGQVQDFGQLAAGYQSQLTGERLRALACSLGVSLTNLQRLGVGWDGSAWVFPMSNDLGKVIGIRRRFPNGRKASITGSKVGLFIPTDLSGTGPLLLCEGLSDAAAAMDLGFDAIGRPNCNSVVQMTIRAAKGRMEVVIVADNDSAGRTGAEKLARVLALRCPCVKTVVPPDGIKDLRQWLGAGLTSETLRKIISTAPPVSVKVDFSCMDTSKRVRP